MKYLLLPLLSLLLFSCQLDPRKKLEAQKRDFNKLGAKTNEAIAKTLDQDYNNYIHNNPQDTAIPTLMFEEAELNRNQLHNLSMSMHLYELIYTTYPKHWRAPDAMFVEAFILDEDLHQIDRAKAKYSEVVQKYPGTRQAKEAAILRDLLGKNLNDMFKDKPL